MKKIIFALCLLFSSSSYAFDKLEATYLALHAIDWAQTREIRPGNRKCDYSYRTETFYNCTGSIEYRETNPILGNHPTSAQVNLYFAATAIAHVLIADALPSDYRKAFQYVTIGIESAVVVRNYQIGIRVGF